MCIIYVYNIYVYNISIGAYLSSVFECIDV